MLTWHEDTTIASSKCQFLNIYTKKFQQIRGMFGCYKRDNKRDVIKFYKEV